MTEEGSRELNREARRIWDRKAAFWDELHGDVGNRFHRTIIAPAAERLLDLRSGEEVLDVACGNGAFARRLAELGARVVACDFSEGLLERARARTADHRDRIDYRLLDATDEQQLLALGEGRFDAAVCCQALMDMATIKPLLDSLGRLLRAGGRFVFSVPHPCFNSIGSKKQVELEEREGVLASVYSVQVSGYIEPRAVLGAGAPGEPEPHYYFDRPISVLFAACFRAGFVLDGLEEPVSPAEEIGERWYSWANYKQIPPALVARFRTTVGTGERSASEQSGTADAEAPCTGA